MMLHTSHISAIAAITSSSASPAGAVTMRPSPSVNTVIPSSATPIAQATAA